MPEQEREKGFTIIEVIAVLILISIVSFILVSRMGSSTEGDIRVKADTLKGHIRYVQMRAMNTDADKSVIATCNASFGMSISANSYFMFKNCDKNLKVMFPGQDSPNIAFVHATLAPASDVTFDHWGRPCSDLNGLIPYNADINLNLGTESILITKNTGFVP